MVSPLGAGLPKGPPNTVHMLTLEQRIEIVATLRIRAHQLRQDAQLSYLSDAARSEALDDAARLTALARLLEGKQITVGHPDRGHAS